MAKVGVAVIGVNGAVASTMIAGVELMVRGLAPRFGMVTEPGKEQLADSLAALLPLARLEDLVFAGWDLRFPNVYEGALEHGVLRKSELEPVREALTALQPWPAVFAQRFAENAQGENIVVADSYRQEIAILTKNLEDFRLDNGLSSIVMVNLASTESWLQPGPVHASLAAFEAGIDANDGDITPAMRYFYTACKLGIPYCNFTPTLINVPALAELANVTKTPFAGMDGKTGQTLLKTALAPMFRVRRLHVDGWFSTNILGNNDGLVLNSPASNKTKVMSKASVLDSIVGYKVENHAIHIHYYKPRGDSKEAWDNIDIQGFLGIPMQIKVNFLCQDSALAAPLCIDIVRLLDVAKRVGDFGIQRQLSLFFKSPFAAPGETPEHDLFKQEALLYKWARAASQRLGTPAGHVAVQA